MALKQMDKALREKFSFNEINPILNTKLDSSELNQILTLCQKIVSRETILILPKGNTADQEIQNNKINCKINKLKSFTNSNSFILKVEDVKYEN